MAKAKVNSVGDGTAVLVIGGPGCKCGTISQKPGKSCGVDMIEVKK